MRNHPLTAGWSQLLAVIALMATACTSPSTGHVASASRMTPVSSPVQQTACTSSNRCLALVTLRGSSNIVVRDITDISHPKTISTVGNLSPQFISAIEVSYVEDGNRLIRAPHGTFSRTVATPIHGIVAFAWSPDGSAAVYLTQTAAGSELHQVTSNGDRRLSSMPRFPATGCESPACADRWDFRLSYSPDGAFVSLVQSAGGPVFRLWTSGGRLLKSVDSTSLPYGQWPSMSAWSGKNLYFRDAKGVEVWRDGVVSIFLPGVAWIRPNASPGWGQIVYAARDAQGWAHSYVVDTVSRQVRDLGKARAEPAFLTSRYIWYQAERLCTAADPCAPELPVIANGKTYINDLQNGTETESIITGVIDIWPHAA